MVPCDVETVVGDFVCIDGIFVGCGDIVGSIDVVAIGLQMLPVIEFLQHR